MSTTDTILAAPPVAATGATLLGFTLSDWACALTIIYTGLLIAWHVKTKWLAKTPAADGQ
ncbi:hypothetical protein D3C81_318070 [compost metagenome]